MFLQLVGVKIIVPPWDKKRSLTRGNWKIVVVLSFDQTEVKNMIFLVLKNLTITLLKEKENDLKIERERGEQKKEKKKLRKQLSQS